MTVQELLAYVENHQKASKDLGQSNDSEGLGEPMANSSRLDGGNCGGGIAPGEKDGEEEEEEEEEVLKGGNILKTLAPTRERDPLLSRLDSMPSAASPPSSILNEGSQKVKEGVFLRCSYLQLCGPSAQKRRSQFSHSSQCSAIRSKAVPA